MKFVFVLGVAIALCYIDEVLPQTTTSGVAGVDMNVIVPCSIIAADYDPSDGAFWKINGSVYGPLQVPSGFSVCDEILSCDLGSLIIPVLQREMNGITIQCVGIDYHNNTQYLGGVTVLKVLPLPQGQLSRNVSLQDGHVERAVLDYPQFSVGPVNTTIGWTYSNLTCHPSVFIIQGYAGRNDIPGNPSLNLTSTPSVLTFPTNITNGSLYWRLLAHDVAGTPCAQESVYFKKTNDAAPVAIFASSDGVGCVPIPVGPRRDYSSLEMVWPERRDTVGRLCYCPPFEGEHNLFSRCISTTSCDTDHSITVSNGSVCFAELSPPLTSIPVYFTLLESCANSRCVIRSILASFMIIMEHPMSLVTPPTADENYNAATLPSATPEIANKESDVVTFELHLYGDNTCIEWINTDQHLKFQQIAMELTMFIQQKCGCPFPSSNITTPQFTCHQSREGHVTYRASVSTMYTSTLTKQELIAGLEEWPRVHRSILLQGERLSVDDMCPVIIQSLDEEECEVPMASQPGSVALSIFLATVASVVVIALVAIAIVIFSCSFRKRRKKCAHAPNSKEDTPPPRNSCGEPVYEDIQELRRSGYVYSRPPLDAHSMAADYMLTECGYSRPPLDAHSVAADYVLTECGYSRPPLDAHSVAADYMLTECGYSRPPLDAHGVAADYMLTECAAYATPGKVIN